MIDAVDSYHNFSGRIRGGMEITMYNEKSRVASSGGGRLSEFYGEKRPESSGSRDFPEKKNAGQNAGQFPGLGKLGRVFSGNNLPPVASSLSGALSNIKDDDVLLLLIIFLLFNENREDDYLVLMVLGALLLS